jgi:hypothetical protein
MMDAVSIQIDALDRLWPVLEPAADRAGTFGYDHVRDEIEAGRALIWPADDSAIVTSLQTLPDRRICLNAWLAGGRLEAVMSLLAEAETWAKRQGATIVHTDCREGFRKPLKAAGYSCLSANFMKEL